MFAVPALTPLLLLPLLEAAAPPAAAPAPKEQLLMENSALDFFRFVETQIKTFTEEQWEVEVQQEPLRRQEEFMFEQYDQVLEPLLKRFAPAYVREIEARAVAGLPLCAAMRNLIDQNIGHDDEDPALRVFYKVQPSLNVVAAYEDLKEKVEEHRAKANARLEFKDLKKVLARQFTMKYPYKYEGNYEKATVLLTRRLHWATLRKELENWFYGFHVDATIKKCEVKRHDHLEISVGRPHKDPVVWKEISKGLAVSGLVNLALMEMFRRQLRRTSLKVFYKALMKPTALSVGLVGAVIAKAHYHHRKADNAKKEEKIVGQTSTPTD